MYNHIKLSLSSEEKKSMWKNKINSSTVLSCRSFHSQEKAEIYWHQKTHNALWWYSARPATQPSYFQFVLMAFHHKPVKCVLIWTLLLAHEKKVGGSAIWEHCPLFYSTVFKLVDYLQEGSPNIDNVQKKTKKKKTLAAEKSLIVTVWLWILNPTCCRAQPER